MIGVSVVRVHIVLDERHEQEDVRLTDDETNIPCGLIEHQSKLWRYFFSKIPLPKFRTGSGLQAGAKWLHHNRIHLLVKADTIATSRRTSFLAEPAAKDVRELICRTAGSPDNVHSNFRYDCLHRSTVDKNVQRTFWKAATAGRQEQNWIAARVPRDRTDDIGHLPL